MENKDSEFLTAISKLPQTRRGIIEICEEILVNSKNTLEEKKAINNAIEKVLLDLQENNHCRNDNDLLLIKHGLRFLFDGQMPASKMAKKIRDNKITGRPPLFD